MLLQKTDKAREELAAGTRLLGLRERSLLLLADGRRSLADLAPLFAGHGEPIVLDLVRRGYLEPVTGTAPSAPRGARSTPSLPR